MLSVLKKYYVITGQIRGLYTLYFVQLLNNIYMSKVDKNRDFALDFVQNIASIKERYIHLTKKNVV